MVNGNILILTMVVNGFDRDFIELLKYERGKMFTKFLSLEPERQVRIINAAIKEFAQKGYKNASTNEIIREAGISKGLLFHYFRNKKSLYLFLYDHSVEILTKEFYGQICFCHEEFFETIRQLFLQEYELYVKHPEMYNFFKSAANVDSEEVKSELDKRVHDLTAVGLGEIMENIDISRFKDGIDMEKAINVIMWSMQGFLKSLGYTPETVFSLDRDRFNEILGKIDEYTEFLKGCFYK